ncbi:MAG: 30S ribosomal protein S5 [Candidatus Altiarchaeales archaeon HGW-Altiarchaeales-2]|nr:MAG: 30S ribosomal protein S5 [Candidatus Altiarchaeales archaeon HGW-Altiarchaeales-2]
MEKTAWVPKTEIGKKVANGEIKSIDEILEKNIRIKEPEIIEKLLPNLGEEILENKRVQRVTTNGRVMRFKVIVAVGDGDGHIGVGQGKAKEVPIAIAQAVRAAKLNIKKINRGCGSWFCDCGKLHTIPITMVGTSGSVSVKLVPAAGGLGLVAGEVTKKVLSLAGIKDVWSWSSGHTRTSLNLAQAVIDALVKCGEIKNFVFKLFENTENYKFSIF